MTRVLSGIPLAAAALMIALPAAPAAAQSEQQGCKAAPDAAPARKKGLGGLLSGARRSGLLGSAMGAARGDGNLPADLTDAARNAAIGAVERSAECAGQQAPRAAGSTDSPPSVEQPRVMRQSVPVRAQPASYSYPGEIPEPAGFTAAKQAYDEFGKVRCRDCEGGFAFDGWAVFPRDEFSGKYDEKEQRMGSWPIGHVHRWRGNASSGTLTVLAEETVAGFRCRTLRYRLAKGKASVERPGLLCWGRQNQFDGTDGWVEVY